MKGRQVQCGFIYGVERGEEESVLSRMCYGMQNRVGTCMLRIWMLDYKYAAGVDL